MFHHIRNSLRQDEGKIPKPIAVSLHNVMTSVGGRDTNDTTWFRRPKHEVALLPLLKLEVLVASTEQYDMEQETTSRVVYTSPSPLRSVQPTWEHLEEKIALAGEWWRGAIYKSMTLRITQMLEDGSYALFLEAPLHPSKLERLQDTPKALPPNALIIDFSDGSTRCTSSMFQILFQHRLAEPSPLEDFSRFEDDVFSTLDSVEPTPSRKRTESVSALLERVDLYSRLIDEFEGNDEEDEMRAELLFEEKEHEAKCADASRERKRLLALIAREECLLSEESHSLEEVR
jgi:hypothetical protein